LSDIYDFHSHILPGIDDGSRDIEMTRQMLAMEVDQGVNHILFTPHFYAQQQSFSQFAENRQHALDKTAELISGMDAKLKYRAAAETYFFKGISEAGILDDLCMQTEDKRVLFLEMPFTQWKTSMYDEVEPIIRKRQLTVVLVHIERFAGFQKDRGVWDAILDLPLILQHNGEFFTHGKFGLFGREGRLAKETMTGDRPLILGTDAHNTTSRHPNLGHAREVIEKKFGRETLDEIDQRSKALWAEGTTE